MNNIRTLADLELQQFDFQDEPEKFFDNISWSIGDKDTKEVRYGLAALIKDDLLGNIPYRDPYEHIYGGDPEDDTVAANHPVVNAILNTPILNKNPFVLYLEPEYDADLERVEFDNIRTAFDVLGAINTYYTDTAKNHHQKIGTILAGHIYFEGLIPYEDGYEIGLGS